MKWMVWEGRGREGKGDLYVQALILLGTKVNPNTQKQILNN